MAGFTAGPTDTNLKWPAGRLPAQAHQKEARTTPVMSSGDNVKSVA